MSSDETPSKIECGCGFRVVSPDIARNRETFGAHACVAWHKSLFGPWAAGIALIVAIAAMQITVTIVSRQ